MSPSISLLLAAIYSFAAAIYAQTLDSGSLTFISASLDDPQTFNHSFPVRFYRIGTKNELTLVSEFFSEEEGVTAETAGIHSIELVGSYAFVDYPWELPSTVMAISTQTGQSVGRFDFNTDSIGVNLGSHKYFVSPSFGVCDLWDVFSGPPQILQGKILAPAPESQRGLCINGANHSLVAGEVKVNFAGLRYSGQSGGSNAYSYPKYLRLSGQFLMTLRNGQPDVKLIAVPGEIQKEFISTGPKKVKPADLDAANDRYFIVTPEVRRANSAFRKLNVAFVFDKDRNNWSRLPTEGNDSALRLFGGWLTEIVRFARFHTPPGCDLSEFRPLSAGVSDGKVPKPMNPDECSDKVPGRLVLYNLLDHRRIVLSGLGRDFEVIDFTTPNVMLLRLGHQLFSQSVEGTHLGSKQLIVDDPEAQRIHWAFQVH